MTALERLAGPAPACTGAGCSQGRDPAACDCGARELAGPSRLLDDPLALRVLFALAAAAVVAAATLSAVL